MDPSWARRPAGATGVPGVPGVRPLSARGHEVLRLVSWERKLEIAASLGLRENAAHRQVASMLTKRNQISCTDGSTYAFHAGLLHRRGVVPDSEDRTPVPL